MHGLRILEATRRATATVLDWLGSAVSVRTSTGQRYGGAAALIGVALVLRMLIGPLDAGIQYVTFFPAVALAAVICGFWPGIVAALIGTALATVLFWPPYAAVDFGFSGRMMLSNTVFLLDALVVCSAVEALHRVHHRLTESESGRRLAGLVYRTATDGVVVTDEQGVIVAVNPAFTDITGFAADEAIGHSTAILRSGLHDGAFFGDMWTKLRRDGVWTGELWNRRKNGKAYLQALHIESIGEAPALPRRYVGVFHDATDAPRGNHPARTVSSCGVDLCRDALTALPNRALMLDRLELAVARARRASQRLVFAVLDIDGFDGVNRALGYRVGDRLLQEVAERLQSNLRGGDTVARIDDDLFALLLENVANPMDSETLVANQLAAIAQPMALEGHAVRVTATAGLATFPDDAHESGELVQRARAALREARAGKRGSIVS